MRYILGAILVSGAIVSAQTHHPHPSPTPQPPVTVAPPIILPLPPLMMPPAGGLTQGFPFRPADPTRPPRDLYRAGRQRPGHLPAPPLYGGGYYGTMESAPPLAPAQPPPVATGLLRLSITPADAQAFVDSTYVGTVEDLDKHPLAFSEGLHRIEIRAPGYQMVSVDVRIDRGATLTYRHTLASTRPAPPERERPQPTSTAPMYVIQNCYFGNVPPRPQRLPAGCDIKNVRILGR